VTLIPLVVALPVLAAAALCALGHFAPPRFDNAVAIGVAAAVTALCVVLMFRSSTHTLHYWFGAWHPRNGIAIGISFSVDPLAAGVAALVGALATAALIVSWDYFDERVPHHFHVLMLVFLGSMAGFALSSDLFNMFVFFELMSVAAFALTGYRIEQSAALQGAINFAVVNSIGAFMLLAGIALLYARTGALNLAQIGQVLARDDADGLVVVAFTLVVVGFLTKAGAVPFHFWLSDAYAVAPAPVCILFAGVMSDLGLHAVGRTYWDAFSGALGGDADLVRAVLIGAGLATALLGAVMAFVQAGVKRMLAFIVISHVGVFLCALGLLTAAGLEGATVYVVADGLVKGALFCAIASLARHVGETDELAAYGRARRLRVTGSLFALGGVALAAIPPLAILEGHGWLRALLAVTSAVSAAAVVRAAVRIFLGRGRREDDLLVRAPRGDEAEERPAPRGGVLLWAPGVVLLLAGIALACAPGVVAGAADHAQRAVDRPAVAREVLHGVRAPAAESGFEPDASRYLYGLAAAALAVALAGLALARPIRVPLSRLKLLHDGVVGDYVAWLTFGTATLGALFALLTLD
jgi:multicomponent Na+:H+ antiporter subunit D